MICFRRHFLFLLVLLAMVSAVFVSPAFAINESGGVITYDGGYIIHTFYGSDTLVPALGVTEVEVLVVAGGGGGGGGNGKNRAGGGGGAGGVIYEAVHAVSGPVVVTVGAGGAGGPKNTLGSNGGDSVFDTLTAVGGGAGGSGNTAGSTGGSGGGGGASNNKNIINGGAGTAGQGNDGGYGQQRKAGGGGGAGAAGGDAADTFAGAGGNGVYYAQFVHSGEGGWFAGGGGGGASGVGNIAGSGGAGGGGDGSNPGAVGANATVNTGGGGGGGSDLGGSGGSGIVIVRYISPAMSIDVYNDVSLAIGPGILVPGEGQDTDTDNTATMDWVSVVGPGELNKISVRIIGGALPAGLQLSVNTPLAAAPVVLSSTDQDLITDIGNESQTGQVLTYTLMVTNCSALFVTTETLTVEYTITTQP